MKAERRHQLQENSLAHALASAPFYLQKYGTQILLGLLIVILAVVLIRNRASSAREARETVAQYLTTVRSDIDQLAASADLSKPDKALEVVRVRRERAEQLLAFIFEHADDP